MKSDILTFKDVQLLVDTFYGKVREDDLLKDIFNNVIQDRWPQHLDKMHRFWQTVLLQEYTYQGSPFPPHFKLPVKQEHFDRWLKLFESTVDEFFVGANADRAKWQGQKMAELFLTKITYYRDRNSIPLI